MQAFETCNIVQTCIEHVRRGNRILIKVIIAELCPLNNIHILPYHTVLLFVSPQLLLQYLMPAFDLQHRSDMHCTCALGNKNFHSGHYCRIMSTVITYIFCQYHTVVLFMSPQLLLQYLMQGFKTCYTVQICTGHVHEGSEI